MQLLTAQQQALEDAKAYAAVHIAEMVEEMIEWHDTAILRDGKVRKLAVLCEQFAGSGHQLKVAEALVQRAAYDFISQLSHNLDTFYEKAL